MRIGIIRWVGILGKLDGYLNKDNIMAQHKRNKSGHRGVSWSTKNKRWVAQIYINGKQNYLGSFINIDDAINAYECAAIEHGKVKNLEPYSGLSHREANLEWQKNNPEKRKVILQRYYCNNKEELLEKSKLDKEKNKQRYAESARTKHRLLKTEVINKYGGQCSCCGISNIDFLSIDHSKDDGKLHREKLGNGGGTNFYHWLKKNNFPDNLGLRVMCYNCNIARSYSLDKICPHRQQNGNENLYEEEINVTD